VVDALRPNGASFEAPNRFRHPNVTQLGDLSVVPYLDQGQAVPVTLAVYPDHGRPAFVGSTIGGSPVLKDIASTLSESESQRLNKAMGRTLDQLLDSGHIESSTVLNSDEAGRPLIHVIIVGDPYKDDSLRLYCHTGDFEGATVLYQDARARKKDASRVERIFKKTGYEAPENWDNKKSSRGKRGR
jgi:hypothetical protein